MAATRAQQNRKIRQEALREQLANQKLVEKVVDSIAQIDELAALKLKDFDDSEVYISEVTAAKSKADLIKISIDSRMKLVNKYLPDLKSTELTGDPENPLTVSQPVLFTDPDDKD